MSSRLSKSQVRSVAYMALLYALAYFAAAWLDLTSTALALRQAGASEGNVYATGEDGYIAARAWAINLTGFLLIEACLIYSALNANCVSEHWLRHPARSFAKIYVNPFARGVADRAALHILSFVLAFPILRLLAVGNNLLIWRTGSGPLGWLIGVLTRASTPTLAFWLVMAPLFYLVAIAVSPLAARILVTLRPALRLNADGSLGG